MHLVFKIEYIKHSFLEGLRTKKYQTVILAYLRYAKPIPDFGGKKLGEVK